MMMIHSFDIKHFDCFRCYATRVPHIFVKILNAEAFMHTSTGYELPGNSSSN